MKVKIANLGVVEKAEIDLKPLTVFIGRNGTGKTWTAYTLASIFTQYGFNQYLKNYLDGRTKKRYPIIDNAINQFVQEGNISINLIDFLEEYADMYINDVAGLAHEWMRDFLNTERVNFEKLQVEFELEDIKAAVVKNVMSYNLEQEISFGTPNKKNVLHLLKEADNHNIYFYIISEDNIFNKLPKRVFERIIFQEVIEILHRAFYPYVYIFPTERTTFISFPAKEEKANIEILDEKEDQIFSEEKSVQLSETVKSLLNILVTSYNKTTTDREEEIQRQPIIFKYFELADLLEKDILQGKVNINESIFGQEVLFEPSENVKLEMTVSSSMVKELAPLVLCLRHLALPNELLIIDEPEMNLHPAAQVEITEFLAMLVQAGLKVLITTHSPYIVDHLSNLMKAAKYEDKESIKERFYLERTEAFIPQDKVSVYLFEDGTAKNILHEDGRIDWGTFGDVSDDISHIFP